MEYSKDRFGVYETTFRYHEPSDNRNYEFRKYVNSKLVKSLGGMYALYCEETNAIIFRRSEYLRDRSYSNFLLNKCVDAIVYEYEVEELVPVCVHEENAVHTVKVKRYYSLPGKIDITKLTEDEFQILRKLIKKSLVTEK